MFISLDKRNATLRCGKYIRKTINRWLTRLRKFLTRKAFFAPDDFLQVKAVLYNY